MVSQNNSTESYFVHDSSFVDDNVRIGMGTKIWHFSHILQNTKIGDNCNIGQNVVVGPDVAIGNGCKIQNNVSVYKGVTLEDNVFCGPSIVFTNVFNPRSHVKRMNEIRPTLVKKGASLGANCTIVCGVTIGEFSFVGAGAVITKDIPNHAMFVGNPARQIGWMCECGEKLNQKMICPDCDKDFSYLITKDNKVKQGSIPFIDLAAQQLHIRPQLEKNIQSVLNHGKYIMGPEVVELEKRLSDFVSVKHTISCSSGTDALVMALMAQKIGPGDAVFTTPYTFFATAEAIVMVGATPVFVDIDYETFNMSPEKLKKAISAVKSNDPSIYPLPNIKNNGAITTPLNPKAIIAVDLFGLLCDYDLLESIAIDNNLFLIEDAAQSFGGTFKDKKAGAFGSIGCTSFFPAKPMGCYGDGGAVFTDSDELAQSLESIRVHGKGSDKYDNERIGLNARLDTIQAAILLAKLDIFSREMEKRQAVTGYYTQVLSELEDRILLPNIPSDSVSAWAQYSVLLKSETIRQRVQSELSQKKIPTMIYYQIPLHLQTAFSSYGYTEGTMPVSEDCSKRILSIPMHPYLDRETQDYIASVFIQIVNNL